MRIIGLAGWSGAGKTTLLTKVIPRLVARGLKVSTAQARASWLRRRPAGQGFARASRGRRDRGAGRLGEALRADARIARRAGAGAARRCCASSRRSISCSSKASSASAHPKLEVYRAAVGKPLLHPDDPTSSRSPPTGRCRRRPCRCSISTTSSAIVDILLAATPRRSRRRWRSRSRRDGAAHRRLLRLFRPADAGRGGRAHDRASASRRSPRSRRVPLGAARGRVVAQRHRRADRPAAVRQFGGRRLRGAPRRSRSAAARRGWPSSSA